MNNETIADILREMRKDMPRVVDTKVILRNYADRIEAAHKREVAVSKTETTTADAAERETVDIESRAIYGEVRESVTNRNALITKSPENVNSDATIYNAAKLREAVLSIRGIVSSYGHKFIRTHILRLCNSALAEPPRNCDAGTAEEQAERFMKFCSSHYNINNVDGECNACPLNENIKTECEFAWMQMPYEEGGAK